MTTPTQYSLPTVLPSVRFTTYTTFSTLSRTCYSFGKDSYLHFGLKAVKMGKMINALNDDILNVKLNNQFTGTSLMFNNAALVEKETIYFMGLTIVNNIQCLCKNVETDDETAIVNRGNQSYLFFPTVNILQKNNIIHKQKRLQVLIGVISIKYAFEIYAVYMRIYSDHINYKKLRIY